MYHLATKRTEKKRAEDDANVSFLRQTIRRALVVLFADFVNFGQSRLSGLSLGAFINSTR